MLRRECLELVLMLQHRRQCSLKKTVAQLTSVMKLEVMVASISAMLAASSAWRAAISRSFFSSASLLL